ncbi:CorA family divalent cation transporter [Qipengyuania sediminis]|uniref:CorA family divalent cation transporter n=1 Tax=Qipengyuania sediminis TaxID=1532023 RepID=UPI00105A3085|nr:CorA family divalent cation transporter [Qipengyuania sediminis]
METRDPAAEPRLATGALLFGRVLDGEGGARPIGWEAAQGWTPARAGEVLWLHLHRTTPGLRDWLRCKLCLPEPTAELLVSDKTRPRAFREGDALVATLRDLNFNPGAEPEDMISMQLWSDGERVLTLRRDPQQSPNEICALLDRGEGPRDAGAMITQIAELMIDHLSGAVVDINDAIDRLEDNPQALAMEERATQIAEIRRDCLALQRHISPEHEALQQISRDAPEWFEPHDRREIAESIARLRRNLDDINISKESALVLQDELRARAQAVSQDATYKLGVMAGVFLPLTFFTGLLGSNVGGIPGSDHPLGFAGVIAACAVITVVILVIFHSRKWL